MQKSTDSPSVVTDPAPCDAIDGRIRAWIAVMDANHELLMAGLRRTVGETGDVEQAYRQWCQAARQQKREGLERVASYFARRSERNAP